jgi:hypothetical protein
MPKNDKEWLEILALHGSIDLYFLKLRDVSLVASIYVTPKGEFTWIWGADMATNQTKFRTALYAGVSVLALAVAAPEVVAADLPAAPIYTKARPQACSPIVTMFLEGGAFRSAGDKLYTPGSRDIASQFGVGEGFENNLASLFDQVPGLGSRPRMGWEAAGGIDYQFACSPWHVSTNLRYGQARSKTKNAFYGPYSTSELPTGGGNYRSTHISGSGQLGHKEDHLVADFMVGRDVGLGSGKSQLKVGVRVANLRAKTTASGNFHFDQFTTTFSFAFHSASMIDAFGQLSQTSKFLGVGPRIALEGSVPFVQQGPWAIDYAVGAAALWGDRKLNLTASGADNGFTQCCGAGSTPSFFSHSGSASFSANKNGVIPNVDASLALAYAVTEHFKIAVGYRIDAYWNALRTFDKNGNIANADRIYAGPFVRATGSF